MIPSPFQQAVFDAVRLGECSLLIKAVAGSGKTTTIVEAVKLLSPNMNVLFLAFNKRIVDELKTRLPSHVNCVTFNSCGFRSWNKYVGKFVKVDAGKTMGIIRDRFTEDDRNVYGSFVVRMVGLAKSAGIGGHLLADIPENWHALRQHHDVTIGRDLDEDLCDYDRAIDLARKTLKLSVDLSNSLVDFDDQIYMPYLKNAAFEKYDRIFIDEAQDTNEVQIAILQKMLKTDGKLIAVGDAGQAIYGFRGADHEAMNRIKTAFDCRELPLSISYRCAKAIVRRAQEYAPGIEAFENAPEGEVVNISKYNASDFLKTDAILCRNNAPLVKMAYSLIRRGVGVNMPGRDFGAGLQKFVRDMRASSLNDLSTKMYSWLQKQIENLSGTSKENKLENLKDKVECLDVIIDNLTPDRQTINALQEEIEFLFQGKKEALTLLSVHKSKGDEWARVFILDFGLMPSKYAKLSWMKIQENNLIYVAITRAKRYLGFIDSDCFADEDDEKREEKRREFATKIASAPAAKSPAKSAGKRKLGIPLSDLIKKKE